MDSEDSDGEDMDDVDIDKEMDGEDCGGTLATTASQPVLTSAMRMAYGNWLTWRLVDQQQIWCHGARLPANFFLLNTWLLSFEHHVVFA